MKRKGNKRFKKVRKKTGKIVYKLKKAYKKKKGKKKK